MQKESSLIIKRSLFSWILPGNIKLQILLVIIIAITVFTKVFPLEMQKRIVNEAINLRKTDLLFLYCGLFLGAVILSSGLKYLTNILHTIISQRVLANMRKELYRHILTLPISFFRKTGPGMVVSSLVTELAPAGEFTGIAIATPLTSGLTLISFAIYLFRLNHWLAILSLSIYPIVLIIVPTLQKRANIANKRRVDETRTISNKITESIAGIHEIHANGSYHIEGGKFDQMANRLLRTRFVWSIYKQSIKVVNNFFNNLSPFLIFLLGGYLTIKGQLELGALVAFLSAQEKLYDPWGELIDFYQLYQDASVGYKKTMDYFDAKPEHDIRPVDRKPYDLTGDIEIRDLSFETDEGIRLIENVNLTLKQGENLALVGFSGSGKSTLAQCIGQLYNYTQGSLSIGNKEVSALTKSDIAHNIGYVAQAPYIFDGTVEENILYACESLSEEENAENRLIMPNLDEIIEVIQQTGIFADILRFGLNTHLQYDNNKDLISQILRVREKFQHDFGEAISDYVEFFNEDKYLHNSTILDNLIFGTPVLDSFREEKICEDGYFLEFLNKANLKMPLLILGDEIGHQTVNILGTIPPNALFFEQSPLTIDELEGYKELFNKRGQKKIHQLKEKDHHMLLKISLRFIPSRHKMVNLPPYLKNLILEGRAMFNGMISMDKPGSISFFNISEYIHSQTIFNNILFGKANTEKPEAIDRIYESMIQLLIEEDLLETIVRLGMQFQVGTRGDRLSGGQRQKVALARVFLKKPKILIMDEATSGLDNKSQMRIQNQIENRWKRKSTVIAVIHRMDIIKNFDRIAVLRDGKIAELGTYDELTEKKGIFFNLLMGGKGLAPAH